MRCKLLKPAFFLRPVATVAPDLLGALLLVDGVGGRVVETEAYDHEDPASHCFGGRRTPRNAPMFGPPGCAYVYRSYGIHWCVNVVCEPGSAVLLRALEPVQGLDQMRARRGLADVRLLCSGPGRLCQALAITAAMNGTRLLLHAAAAVAPSTAGPRIGITKAVTTPWRFIVAGSPYVSRPTKNG